MRFRSPTVESILEWRRHPQVKYRVQPAEELTRDERSAFGDSEDVATGSDVPTQYVPVVHDRTGPAGPTQLIGRVTTARDEIDAPFAEADRRGFDRQFPQLLLGASSRLPFERDLMIKEPNWEGSTQRYGSLIRAAIAEADPTVRAPQVWRL